MWTPFMEGTRDRTHIRVVCLKAGTALRPYLVPWGRAGYACSRFTKAVREGCRGRVEYCPYAAIPEY